jgi:hypothetical protein
MGLSFQGPRRSELPAKLGADGSYRLAEVSLLRPEPRPTDQKSPLALTQRQAQAALAPLKKDSALSDPRASQGPGRLAHPAATDRAGDSGADRVGECVPLLF